MWQNLPSLRNVTPKTNKQSYIVQDDKCIFYRANLKGTPNNTLQMKTFATSDILECHLCFKIYHHPSSKLCNFDDDLWDKKYNNFMQYMSKWVWMSELRVHATIVIEIRARIGFVRRCVGNIVECDQRETIVSKFNP